MTNDRSLYLFTHNINRLTSTYTDAFFTFSSPPHRKDAKAKNQEDGKWNIKKVKEQKLNRELSVREWKSLKSLQAWTEKSWRRNKILYETLLDTNNMKSEDDVVSSHPFDSSNFQLISHIFCCSGLCRDQCYQ